MIRGGVRKVASPSCKIRLGTNGETSRVSTEKFKVSRHKNRSCKYMEDMYGDNDYINETSCPVRDTSESGDELIILRGQLVHWKDRTTFTTTLLSGTSRHFL